MGVRPPARRPIDRQLAYAQSFWICKYIEETYGHDAILKMLDEFKNGGSGGRRVPEGHWARSIASSTRTSSRWSEKQVATWGYDEETSKKYDELREAARS